MKTERVRNGFQIQRTYNDPPRTLYYQPAQQSLNVERFNDSASQCTRDLIRRLTILSASLHNLPSLPACHCREADTHIGTCSATNFFRFLSMVDLDDSSRDGTSAGVMGVPAYLPKANEFSSSTTVFAATPCPMPPETWIRSDFSGVVERGRDGNGERMLVMIGMSCVVVGVNAGVAGTDGVVDSRSAMMGTIAGCVVVCAPTTFLTGRMMHKCMRAVRCEGI